MVKTKKSFIGNGKMNFVVADFNDYNNFEIIAKNNDGDGVTDTYFIDTASDCEFDSFLAVQT